MTKYILKRLLLMIPVLFCIAFLIFTIMYFTPGDPVRTMLGEQATDEMVEEMREEWGLNDPFLVRFGNYLYGLLHGDLGTSYTTRMSVTTEILDRFPTTLLLAVLSIIVALLIGIVAGIIAATKQYSIFDNIATSISLFGLSMPAFWQGLMLILLFSVWLKWLPPSGFSTPVHWILPVLSVGPSTSCTIMRMTRSSMLEVLRSDYIRTARAKGAKESVVICVHALKNALIPIITTAGLSFGNLLGGAVMCETIFNISGLGKMMVDAINNRNYPLVQGAVLFIAIVVSFVNLGVDILYAFADPRIKSQYSRKKTKLRKQTEEGAS